MVRTASSARLASPLGRCLLTTTLIASVSLAPALAQAEETDDRRYASMTKEELEYTRHDKNIAGPIALLTVGSVVFLISTPVVLIAAAVSASCDANCDPAHGVLVTSSVIAASGVGMGVGGGLWLGSRLGDRRAAEAELKRRREEEETLLHPPQAEAEVSYGLVPTPGGLGLGVFGTF